MVVKITEKIKFYLPVEQERLLKIMKWVIISLASLALVLGSVCGVFYFMTDRLTVEAGSRITAEDITGNKDSYFGADFDPEWLNSAGVYSFTVITGGREQTVQLTVVDTKAPEVKVKQINWPIGADRAPKAEDFIDTVSEADEFSGFFVEEFPEFKRMGEYSAKIRFKDASGNKTEVIDVTLSLVSDSEGPKIRLLADAVAVKVGHDIAESGKQFYFDMALVSDNCAGDLRLEVDDSGVDYTEVGRYTVYFTAYDMVNNRSERVRFTVDVVEELPEGIE